MNPFLVRNKLPEFSVVKTSHVMPAINKVINDNNKVISQIESMSELPNWINFITPLEICNEKLDRVWSYINHINAVKSSSSYRKVYNQALEKVTEYSSNLGQSKILYKKYKKLLQNSSNLSSSQKKLIKNEITSFELSGVALPEKQKLKFKKIQNNLSKLSSSFDENILDSINTFELIISDKNSLKGIPNNVINSALIKAKAKKINGWLFTIDFPSYLPIMQYAENRKLRKNIYTAYNTKASSLMSKDLDNTDNIRNILKLKYQLSKLLGYSSISSMLLKTKMAKSSKEVSSFLSKLTKKAKKSALSDINDINVIAKELNISKVKPWDIPYLSEKLKKRRFSITDEEIKEYFPINNVLHGLFNICKRIYSLNIIETNASIWHEDVRFFEIYNEEKKLVGSFYLDLYARKNKRGGAWMDEAISKYRFMQEEENPVAYLTCNFTPPSKGNAYLTHDEVITLFHEFGHGLHHLLTEVTEYSISGIKGVEWDAVELPSQFMENYCWEWSVIKDMSYNDKTKTNMPKQIFNKLLESKNFQSGMQTLRQVEFALFDIKLHSEYSSQNRNFMKILDSARAQVSVIKTPTWNRFPHSFSHIFSGGYSSAYYSYKWAEVLSADAYSLFEEIGILSKKAGTKFKKEILSKGGSRSAMESFIAFRGRKPEIQALLAHHGLIS
ncbi:M3 family metallopeptidase [Methylophilaceae bacterium]|jgi:oligopeptidase A|nr:M3 family metallopeptidase [Methylophilaceae bacterium]